MNLYEYLNVSKNASKRLINIAYRKKALKVHPDKNGGSTEEFQKLERTKRILTNSYLRWIYDMFGDGEELGGAFETQSGEEAYESTSSANVSIIVDSEDDCSTIAASEDDCSIREANEVNSNIINIELGDSETEDDLDEDSGIFEVEEIKDVIRILGDLYFKIKWLNYREETWEPIENLRGCPEKLSKFWQQNGDVVEDFAGAGSASASVQIDNSFNFSNWLSCKQVLECIKRHQMRMNHLKKEIEIVKFVTLGREDKIYVLLHHAHFFVFIHLFKEKIIYITDGNNTYLRFQLVREVIGPVIKGKRRIKIIPIENNYQTKIDECGSAAILAVLQLRSWYENQHGQPNLKNANKWLKTRLRQLHKQNSLRLKTGRNRIDKIPREKCPYCDKDFNYSKRSKNAHIKFKHKSSNHHTNTIPVHSKKV